MKISSFLKYSAVPILLASVLILSCDTDEINPGSFFNGREYYPVEVGNYWIYKVDTTKYTSGGSAVNGSFYRKEKISDTLPDQEGAKVFRIEIYKSSDTSLPWQLDSVWSVRVGTDKIIKTENNRPYLKLFFPLEEGSQWDGNQYNIEQDSSRVYLYTVRNPGKSALFQNREIETVEIVQKIDSNCINNSYFTEVYYKGIGLGFRRKSYKEYESCVGIPVVVQGYTINYTLTSYGHEE